MKMTIVTDGCLCLRFVSNSIFLNPRQYSHWFNLNISAATCVLVLQAVTQITYAVGFFSSLLLFLRISCPLNCCGNCWTRK